MPQGSWQTRGRTSWEMLLFGLRVFCHFVADIIRDRLTTTMSSEVRATKKPKVEASHNLTERQQLALLLKHTQKEDDSDDEEDDSGAAVSAVKGDDSDDDDDGGNDGAPGMVAEFKAAQRWWEGSAGFDFASAKTKQNEEDGMQVAGDPDGMVGRIVKRSFGRGIISFGKVVGWFPPEEEGDEALYHVLHGDGDEEDLDPAEVKEAVAWAEASKADSMAETNGEAGEGQAEAQARTLAAELEVGGNGVRAEKARAQVSAAAAARTSALAALLRKPQRYDKPAAGPIEAAERGVNFIFALSRDDANLGTFGSDLVQTLYDISSVAPEPIRKAALQRVEVASQRWKARFQRLADLVAEPQKGPQPNELVDAVMGLYALERVGLEHPLKQETAAFLRKSKLTAKDFVQFDVSRPAALEAPDFRDDKFTVLTAALNTAFFATQVGIELAPGLTLPAVCAHVKGMRPYKPPSALRSEEGVDEWVEQITLVFNLVHVCSSFGELRLRPSTLQPECDFLRSPATMALALSKRDVHIVGEICHCLRVFGNAPATCAPLRDGLAFLLSAQNVRDGGWPTREDDDKPYTKYHAAMCATMGLYEPCFRGFGPGSQPLKAMLDKWSRRDRREASARAADAGAGGGGGGGGAEGTGDGADALPPVGALVAAEEAYSGDTDGRAALHAAFFGQRGRANGALQPEKHRQLRKEAKDALKGPRSIAADGRPVTLPLAERAEARLNGLLRWRVAVDGSSLDDFRGVAKQRGDRGGGGGRSSAAARSRALELAQRAPVDYPSVASPKKRKKDDSDEEWSNATPKDIEGML